MNLKISLESRKPEAYIQGSASERWQRTLFTKAETAYALKSQCWGYRCGPKSTLLMKGQQQKTWHLTADRNWNLTNITRKTCLSIKTERRRQGARRKKEPPVWSQGCPRGDTTETGVHAEKTRVSAKGSPQQSQWLQRSVSEGKTIMKEKTPPKADVGPIKKRGEQRRGICGMKPSWALATDVCVFGVPKSMT